MEDLINSNVMILSIVPNDIKELINTIKQYNLDFDDAYQYFLIKKI